MEEESLEARTRLGECFQRMGLTSDALREFQDAFKLCQKRELKREAFELLRRLASLDPSNIANRLNLAGLFVREKMLDDAQREFASLLEEVRRQSGSDLIVRVAEQMLHAFPDSSEALGALVGAKVASGAHADAVRLLEPAVAKAPDDISLRESLVNAYEAAGDATAARRVWRDIAELYKRRGDLEKSRDILQRFVTAEELSLDDGNTTPSLLLTDSTGRSPADDVLELDEPEESAPPRPAPTPAPAAKPRVATIVETGRATPPPVRSAAPTLSTPAEPAPVSQVVADLIAEARVSLEFGDRAEALRIARQVLELAPESEEANELLARAGELSAAGDDGGLSDLLEVNSLVPSDELTEAPPPLPEIELEGADPEIDAFEPGEDFDTLPDIEIMLEDEEDRDEQFASVDPPLEIALEGTPPRALARPAAPAKPEPPAPAKTQAPAVEDPLDFELEIDAVEADEVDEVEGEAALEFAKPLASERGESQADVSAKVTENLSEADFYLEQGLVDEAEKIYQGVLALAPHHPKAMLRLGEISARRGKGPGVEVEIPANALGDTIVCDPGASEPPDLSESAELFESIELEPSVVGEDTIPPLEELEPAPDDEIVFAEDTSPPVALASPPDDPDELEVTHQGADEEGEFDLAAMLDEEESTTGKTIGTLVGVGSVGRGFAEVFSAFKKGIEDQVEEGDSDTHYDLAIAYKEMGLFEDAVRELEVVLRTGARMIEALSLLASCRLALGDPTAAAAHLEAALARAGDSDEAMVALRYDLGEALLAAGRDAEAREAFSKVAAIDPGFRDVAERLARFG